MKYTLVWLTVLFSNLPINIHAHCENVYQGGERRAVARNFRQHLIQHA